jgi:REP element-mobilizing transposase RayT
VQGAHDPRRSRRSIRHPGFNYADPGAYFITLCAYQRRFLFGQMVGGKMSLSACGRIVEEEWRRTQSIRSEISLDQFVIMPNHIHAIVKISDRNNRDSDYLLLVRRSRLSRRSLGSLVAGFKSSVTKRVKEQRQVSSDPLWQRNYYEHVIRDQKDLLSLRDYIATNPMRWAFDRENPQRDKPV